jgi:hypothetical protein
MAVAPPSPPETGQLVSVRSRRWVVIEVLTSTLTHPRLAIASARPQQLVSLLSFEDHALGEDLQVFWEPEPGARVREKVALPEAGGFDDSERPDAVLNAQAE